MSRRIRTVRVLWLLLLGVSTSCRSQEAASAEDSLRVAYSSKIFYEVDLKDAQVAIALWSAEISRQLQAPLVPSTRILSNLQEMEEAVRSKTVDMIAITSLDYLKIHDDLDLEPAIVGMAEAARIAAQEMATEAPRLAKLRDRLVAEILKTIPDTYLNGHPTERLPNNAHLRFEGIEGESLVLSLRDEGVAAATGSACSSKTLEPSHTLILSKPLNKNRPRIISNT